MPYGLKAHTVETIKNVFLKYNQVEKVILYGSRAKGNYRTGSDIDLTIAGNNLNLSILYKIENDLDGLNLPYTFDISIHNHIKNEDFLGHINRVGIEFYSKGKNNH